MNTSVISLSRYAPGLASLAAMVAFAMLAVPIASAQGTQPAREVPARMLPVPTTVSPQMQKIIGTPINPNWKVIPQTPEEWKAQVVKAAAASGHRTRHADVGSDRRGRFVPNQCDGR